MFISIFARVYQTSAHSDTGCALHNPKRNHPPAQLHRNSQAFGPLEKSGDHSLGQFYQVQGWMPSRDHAISYLTYFWFNHLSAKFFRTRGLGQEEKEIKVRSCFLPWIPLGNHQLITLIVFARWFFLFIYLRYILGKKKEILSRKEYCFLMGKNAQLYWGIEWSSANEFTLIKHWNSPKHTN